jgi:hypothetical protein
VGGGFGAGDRVALCGGPGSGRGSRRGRGMAEAWGRRLCGTCPVGSGPCRPDRPRRAIAGCPVCRVPCVRPARRGVRGRPRPRRSPSWRGRCARCRCRCRCRWRWRWRAMADDQ